MKIHYWTVFGLVATLCLAPVAGAAEPDLQQKIDELSKQVEQLKQQAAKVDELSRQVDELKKQAAEKKMAQAPATPTQSPAEYMKSKSRVHLAGYGSIGYSDSENDNGRFNQAQFSPIFHYLYDDLALMEAELEITNSPSGETETDLEYATIDVFLNDHLAVFGGKFLSPLGQFRQNLHPSWVNKTPAAPLGFGHDGATPLNDVGVGLRGGGSLGAGWRTDYAVYVGNGPTLVTEEEEGETAFNMATEGSTSDADGNKVFGGRIGFLPPVGNTEFGISAAFGKVGTAEEDAPTALFPGEPDRDYSVIGADAVYHWKQLLELRGEYIRQHVDANSESVLHPGSLNFKAAYLQAAYQLPDTKWEGILRWGTIDTPNEDQKQDQWTVGVDYLFAPNVIAKLAYEFNQFDLAGKPDDNTLMMQLAFGF